jgi:hypothetical protein
MPLYEMPPDAFRPLSQALFADLKVRERDDQCHKDFVVA